jgi:Icc-related predicted phosphoesterase
MKITFISDTHTRHRAVEADLPGGDLLIHAGDFMNSGYHKEEAEEFFTWFDGIKGYDKKIFIAGNHDRIMQMQPEWATDILNDYKTIDYLRDEGFAYYDMDMDRSTKIYGSPWQPEFFNWAFNLPRNGEEMKAKWDAIPDDTDILITHGPPYGYLDVPGGKKFQVGCELLRERIDAMQPKIHVFGHIHGSAGYYFNGHTHFINASVLDERYTYTNLPLTFEWDRITNEIQWQRD